MAEVRANAMDRLRLRMSVANLPGRAVIHLRAVQPSDTMIALSKTSRHRSMIRRGAVGPPIGDLPVLEEYKGPADLMAVLHEFIFDAPKP